MENNFNTKLAEALSHVARLKGISHVEDVGICVNGKYTDDYLSVFYLAKLLENGQLEVKVTPSKIDYLFKLLHVEED